MRRLPASPPRRGATLVELLVVLLVLGLTLGLSVLALGATAPAAEAAHARALRVARSEAIRRGRPVSIRLDTVVTDAAVDVNTPQPVVPESASGAVLFLPDGRAIGPGVDALTGLPAAEARHDGP